jgi:hypothetical protein
MRIAFLSPKIVLLRSETWSFTIHFRTFYFLFFPSKNIKIKTHESIILPVAMYVCETCSLNLREEHTVRMFNKVYLREFLDLRELKW